MRRKEPIDVLRPLKIKVVLCRLGRMEQAKFDLYANIVRKSKRINLAELTPLLGTSVPLSVLLKQIGSSGYIYFEFVDVEEAVEMADSEDYQLYHRVFAAIGIGYHDSCRSDHDQFDSITKPLKHCAVTRHFAFEPGEEAEDNHKDIVVIPNQDLDQVQFYLQTMLNDFAISLLRRFDQLSQEIGSQPEFPSPRDFDSTLAKEVQAKIHLRFAGRRFKLLGDLYLLAGAYNEAVTSYVGASEETKSAGDHLWHAGAQEGLQVALCLQQYNSLDTTDMSTRREIWWSLPGRLKDVAVLYDKSVMPRYSFAVQTQVADVCLALGDLGEASSALSTGWNSCRPLVVQEKLAVLAGLITKFESFGMQRKANFYRKRLVFHLSNLDQHALASRLILPTVGTCWLELKHSLLSQAMDLAESAQEYGRFTELALQLLSSAAQVLTTSEQEALKEKIKSHSKKLMPFKTVLHNMGCFNPTVSVEQAQSSRVETVETTRKASPLVYMPLSRGRPERKDETPIGIVGEPILLKIILDNPFAFRLNIKKLLISSNKVECDPIDLVLEPLEKGRSTVLYVTPKIEGELSLGEVSMVLFKVHQVLVSFEAAKLKIHVAQPLLRLLSSPKHIELIEGQTEYVLVEVQNVNWTDLTYLSLSAPDCVSLEDVPMVIPAQGSATLKLKIRGSTDNGSWVSVNVDYSHRVDDVSPYLVRTLKIDIPFTVRAGLAITSLSFVPLSAQGEAVAALSSFDNLSVVLEEKATSTCLDSSKWCYAVLDIVNESPLSYRCQLQDDDTFFQISPSSVRRIVVPFRRVGMASDVIVNLLWKTSDGRVGEVLVEDFLLGESSLRAVKVPPIHVSVSYRQEGDEDWKVASDNLTCPIDTFTELRFKSNANKEVIVRPAVPGLDQWTNFVFIDGFLQSQDGEIAFKIMSLNRTIVQLDCFSTDDNTLIHQLVIRYT